jgi:hypothetical protein
MNKSIALSCGLGVAAICTFAACTTVRVTTDVNSALISSVHCRTFAWSGAFHPRPGAPLRSTIANPLNEARLRTAITASLASKGVQPATDGADCLVGYGIGSRNVVEGAAYPPGWGWGWGYGWGWGGYGYWGWDWPYVYREGIIGVDLYDAKTRQPFWHAMANQSLNGLTGADAEKKINEAVAAMFAKYPAS